MSRQKLAVALFFAALWAPLIGTFFSTGALQPEDENRVLASLPSRADSWRSVPRLLTRYFHDHFGFRGWLVVGQAWLKTRILGVSSSPDVILGSDGWLFYAAEGSLANHRGARPFAPEELDRWIQLFRHRHEWLKGRGIRMLIVVAPDKQTIYPEMMAREFRNPGVLTRLDEFAAALRSVPELRLIDLRPALREAKGRYSPLYLHTDTHWTTAGGYVAYREILRDLNEVYPDLAPIAYATVPGPPAVGDLTKMLGLASLYREAEERFPLPDIPATLTQEGDVLLQQREPGNMRRLSVYGDSFAYSLVPFLGQYFERTRVTPSMAVKPAMLLEEHPDIVLFEMVERRLNGAVPADPVGEMQ